MHRLIWVLITTALICGCDEGSARGRRNAPAQARLQPVEVVTDDQTVDAAKGAWEDRHAQAVEAALGGIREGLGAGDDAALLFEQHRDIVVPQLVSIVDGAGESANISSVLAADVLQYMNHALGQKHLLQAMRTPDPELRFIALEFLTYNATEEYLAQPETQAVLLPLMDHSWDAGGHSVYFTYSRSALPQFEQKVRAALTRGDLPPADAIAAIGASTTDPALVDMLIQLVQSRDLDPKESVRPLAELLSNPDPAVADRVRQGCSSLVRTHGDILREEYEFVYALAKHGDARHAHWLEEVLARSDHPSARRYALKGLLRLEPRQALALALKYRAAAPSVAMRTLAQVSAGGNKKAVFDIIASANPHDIDATTVRAILANFGQEGRTLVQQMAPGMFHHQRLGVEWQLQGLTLAGALEEFHAAAMLPIPPNEAIDRWREEKLRLLSAISDEASDPDHPSQLLDALALGGGALEISPFEFSPGRTDHLLMGLSKLSRRAFSPQFIAPDWTPPRPPLKDASPVQFIANGRLYLFSTRRSDEFHDVEAVVAVANKAMEDSLDSARFALCGRDIGDPVVLFGPAETLHVLIEKYHLTSLEDAAED